MDDFNNWLDDMNFEFENDFLGLNKSKVNNVLNDNDINSID